MISTDLIGTHSICWLQTENYATFYKTGSRVCIHWAGGDDAVKGHLSSKAPRAKMTAGITLKGGTDSKSVYVYNGERCLPGLSDSKI